MRSATGRRALLSGLSWLGVLLGIRAATAQSAQQTAQTPDVSEQLRKSTQQDYPDQPFVIMARIRARPGREEDLRQRLIVVSKQSQFEPGCLSYEWLQEERVLSTGTVDPSYFRSYEWWENEAALRFHTTSPHYKAFFDLEQRDPVIAEVTNTLMKKLRD
jgi:quinol monooxygenase YgiN